MMMLDGKIQKLIMLLDQYIDDSRILRIKPGIDEKLDALQDEIDDYLEKFAEKQADAAEILGLPPTGRLEISLVLWPNLAIYFEHDVRKISLRKNFRSFLQTSNLKKLIVKGTSSELRIDTNQISTKNSMSSQSNVLV